MENGNSNGYADYIFRKLNQKEEFDFQIKEKKRNLIIYKLTHKQTKKEI